jgi:hypothetical protein
MAVAFHESSMELWEELVCFRQGPPLQSVFEGVDGHTSAPWDAQSNPREKLEPGEKIKETKTATMDGRWTAAIQ